MIIYIFLLKVASVKLIIYFFRCVTEGCGYLFSQPVQVSVNCPRCKKKISLKKSLDILKYCEEQYKTGLTIFDSEKPDEAAPILSEAVDLFHR